MGCCSSRSTTISPEERSPGGGPTKAAPSRASSKAKASIDSKTKRIVDIGTSLDRQTTISSQSAGERELEARDQAAGGSNIELEDHFISILMEGHGDGEKPAPGANQADVNPSKINPEGAYDETSKLLESSSDSPREPPNEGEEASGEQQSPATVDNEGRKSSDSKPASPDVERATVAVPIDERSLDEESNATSFEDELNMDLLQQYIAIDYEISQLEDRDALRLYHERIEQLEQLERELDMISSEAEDMAVRSELDLSIQSDRNRNDSDGPMLDGKDKRQKDDPESDSIASGLSVGSLSNKSLLNRDATQQQRDQQQLQTSQPASAPNKGQPAMAMSRTGSTSRRETSNLNGNRKTGMELVQMGQINEMSKDSNFSYATIEEVFNRKIILEKERDRLKKEVELVIIECDRLQSKYKRRDMILDKLFDGRTGNGLENHLEQQLNWLMEQKHYVDQVYYAWKRAETLISHTCELFASALDILKRLPKVSDEEQRKELSRNVCSLLLKSSQDMEQAQSYNPNVDAPFFTDAEVERFDRIIKKIESAPLKPSEYNQIATMIEFAFKRSQNIRLWLEQIIQITIARDSFELAEEHKWIAIQLRKERISLINVKLQDPPYRQIAQTIRDQLASQQQRQQQQLENPHRLAISDGRSTTPSTTRSCKQGGEFNRDSGIESDDIDIEEDIYRLLEMNKSRFEAAVAASREAGTLQTTPLDAIGRPLKPAPPTPSGFRSNRPPGSLNGLTQSGSTTSGRRMSQHDRIMQARVQRRVSGELPLAVNNGIAMGLSKSGRFGGAEQEVASSKAASLPRDPPDSAGATSQTPSKLRIQLDEESKRDLLKQVDSIHSRHRTKLDKLRGSNKAKANDILMRLRSASQQINQAEQIGGRPG